MSDVRVAIVGAGPQGLTVAVHLVAAGLPPSELLVVDPAGGWLRRWHDRFAALGIAHLRSPSVHHPHPDPYALLRFAKAHHREDELVHRYGLPSTDLFAAFCAVTAEDLGVAEVVRPALVTELDGEGRLHLDDGTTLRAEVVVWAGDPHVEERLPDLPGLCRWPGEGTLDGGRRVAVVGGGLTAAHLVERAIERDLHVDWVTRRPVVEREFDADPGWLGPKELAGFEALADPGARLAAVLQARGGGSVPGWSLRRIAVAEARGQVCRRVGPVALGAGPDGRAQVLVDGSPVAADGVWLAVGDRPDVTGAPTLAACAARAGAALVGGRPVLDDLLRLPGTSVHVVGRLAQLSLGPTAGNLSGARRAAVLVVEAVLGAAARYELSLA